MTYTLKQLAKPIRSTPETRIDNTGERIPLEGVSINLLVVGESQNGKSQLITKIHEVAGVTPDSSLHVGKGGQAETLATTTYKVNYPLRPLTIKRKGADDTKLNVDQIVKNPQEFLALCSDSNLEIVREDPPTYVTLSLIDTPGLNGTDANDEDNMCGLAQELSKIGYINGVLLVNKGGNYGPIFKRTVEYYLNLISNKSAPLDLVHTKFTTDDMYNAMVDNQVGDKHPRVTQYKDVFKDTLAKHWFIDSLPLRGMAFREYVVESTLNDIIVSMTSRGMITTTNLAMTKTIRMKHADAMVISINTASSAGYISGAAKNNKALEEVASKMRSMASTIADTESKIASIEAHLKDIDSTEQEQIGTGSVNKGWGVWGVKDIIKISTAHVIVAVDKKITDGACEFDNSTETAYGDSHNNKDYSIEVKSGMFRGCYASVTAFGRKRLMYAETIKSENERLRDLQESLTKLRAERAAEEGKDEDLKVELKLLNEKIEAYNKTTPEIRKDKIPLDFYTIVKDQYRPDIWEGESQSRKEEMSESLTRAYLAYFFESTADLTPVSK
ncbi:hypothetical protein HDU86_001342 [Geranomyces michiganensis]|nr:hypothetical protein HDU86_001342 [Geranomyces michiganensis]